MASENLQKLATVLSHIQRRVNAYIEKNAEMEKRLPQVLDALVANNRITPDQRAAAATMIKDASKCLDFIEALAKHRSNVSQSLGVPVSKRAAVSKRPIGGPITDYDETEAGQVFRQILTSGRSDW